MAEKETPYAGIDHHLHNLLDPPARIWTIDRRWLILRTLCIPRHRSPRIPSVIPYRNYRGLRWDGRPLGLGSITATSASGKRAAPRGLNAL
jgi:hypothetical protein